MNDDLARRCGFSIARDCLLHDRRSRGPRAGDAYLKALRERCGRGRDHTLALVLDELERRARARQLGSPGSLLGLADQLERDVPVALDARALLDGVRDAARQDGSRLSAAAPTERRESRRPAV